jgi:hypothetical protein
VTDDVDRSRATADELRDRALGDDPALVDRLAPAEGAGLEHLFFELTASGTTAPSPTTDSIHPELAGANA